MKKCIALLVCLVLSLAACAAPPLVSGGGGAGTSQDTDGKTATMEPQVGLVQPGAFGGVTQSKLAYQRQSTGTQSAPSVILNLQPAAGASVAGTYPALRLIVLSPVIVMGNSQVEPTLTEGQIKAVGDVTKEAGDALKSAIEAAAKAPVAPDATVESPPK